MNQSQWDNLEENKQDIIEGKAIICEYWDFEVFGSMESTLTEKEKIEAFRRFHGYAIPFYEVGLDILQEVINDIIGERENTES